MQIKDLGTIFKTIFSDIKINYVEDKEDERSYKVDFTKIKEVLDFEPKQNIISGIKKLKEFLENNPDLELDEKQYSNLSNMLSISFDITNPHFEDVMLDDAKIERIIKEMS